MTYLPTNEGFAYLVSILDLGSHRLVGWALGTSMTVELVKRAFKMALRCVDAEFYPAPFSIPIKAVNIALMRFRSACVKLKCEQA